MLSCLRGHSSDSLFRHLRETGTHEEKFSRNPVALTSWFEKLREGVVPQDDSQVLALTTEMFNQDRTKRPTAAETVGTISGLEERFMCFKCREETGGMPRLCLPPVIPAEPSANNSRDQVVASPKEHPRSSSSLSESVPRCPENVDEVLQLQTDATLQILEERNVNVRDPQVRGPTLCRAAHKGDALLVELLASITQNLNYRDTAGYTPLMRAATHRDPSMVRILLQQNLDIAVVGEFIEDGKPKLNTALDIALDKGNAEVVRELVIGYYERDLGVDTGTAIHRAIQRKHTDVMTVLLDLGAYPNYVEAYGMVERSALYVAVLHGCLSAVDVLIRHGADPSMRETQTGKTIAHAAVQTGDVNVVEGLLDRYIEFTETDFNGSTPLHEAVWLGNKDIVNLFLRIGLNVNSVDNEGDSPLLLAVEHSHAQLIRSLISAGADISLRNKRMQNVTTLVESTKNTFVLQILLDTIPVLYSDGSTLLHRAVAAGNLEFVQLLLRKVPYTSLAKTEDQKQTPLHFAALHKNEAILRALLNQPDCPTKEKDINGNTPLHCALLGPQDSPDSTVELLYSRDPSIMSSTNAAGETPIVKACTADHTSAVRFLLERAPHSGPLRDSVNAKDDHGNTLLHVAAKNGSQGVVDELLAMGASPTAADAFGYFPSTLALSSGHTQTAHAMRDRPGFDADAYPDAPAAATFASHTQLMIASRHGHADLAAALLDLGCDIEHRSAATAGETPLSCAIAANRVEAVRLLLRRGCDAESRHPQRGATPLMLAAQLGHAGAVAALVEHGVRLGTAARNGTTALAKAADRGHLAVVRALAVRGAGVLEKADKDGYTPLYRAVWRGHREVAELLVERGADAKKVRRMLEWSRAREAREAAAAALLREVVERERGRAAAAEGGGARRR